MPTHPAPPLTSSTTTQGAEPLAADAATDPFQWLEEVESPAAQAWVAAQNAATGAVLTADPRYAPTKALFKELLTAPDRLPDVELHGAYVYNLWQDDTHKKGLWRRVRLELFSQQPVPWDTLLDVDQMAAADGENWVWAHADFLPPANTLCLVSLSRGGKDAVVTREFDVEAKAFVSGGFELPEAKSRTSWASEQDVFVATDWGPGTMTTSGYPAQVRLWRRGTRWQDAPLVHAGPLSSMVVSATSYYGDGAAGSLQVVTEQLDFYHSQAFLRGSDGRLRALAVPRDAEIATCCQGRLILRLRSDWRQGAAVFPAGSLVSYDPASNAAALVYSPGSNSAVDSVHATRSRLFVARLEHATSQLSAYSLNDDGEWAEQQLALPGRGTAQVLAADPGAESAFVTFESFLIPKALYLLDGTKPVPGLTRLLQVPARFAAEAYEFSQFFVASKDGTQVPYFMVHRRGLTLSGDHPTLIYAYGGFEVPLTPTYSAGLGQAWLDKGGVYVLANIRGGGEYGPRWHQSALKHNRQRAYDDFLAVADDLVARGVTQPRRLGIRGGSNGGLLVGAVMVQRPDLFHAVYCEVALLDMVRFPAIAAGASWQAEYGDPALAADLAVLRSYSPYHNVRAGQQYPRAFFSTSTYDDRVGPGHARKMAAKMGAQSQPYYFHESAVGGHSTPASADDAATYSALAYTYLYQQLLT